MSTTGLTVFDTTIQETNQWLNAIVEELGQGDSQLAYSGLRATLHALRDRIPTDVAAEFGAQLPMLVRGFYYEGYVPSHAPIKDRRKEEFLERIAEMYHNKDIDLEKLAMAVFSTVNRFVSKGSAEKTRDMLNERVRELWPSP